MRVASGVTAKAAGMACAAVCLLAAMPLLAQTDAEQRSGVSHPSATPIAADAGDGVGGAAAAKPSAAIPATNSATAAETVYAPYTPYLPAGAKQASEPEKAFDPDANIVTQATAGRRELSDADNAKEDAGIVTHVPSQQGEVPEGTLVKANLGEQLSTLTTRPGTKFTASVSEPVLRDGRVIVPVGSVMEGRVTWVRGGKRIGGSAAIHIEPRTVTLPDGAQYVLRARVIDTNSWQNTKVDGEGTIMRSENTKRNVGVMSLTTGGGAAAGAMVGGPAGALIGAGVGAGVSTVIWLKQDRQAVLPKDLGLVFSLTEPMSITPARAAVAPMKIGANGGQ